MKITTKIFSLILIFLFMIESIAYNIGIALDDFGTGYSSLAYLRKIPLTTLKIDKSFINDISSLDSNITIIDSIIDLGHKLGIDIVAEGVETKEQLEYLVKNNCDKIQGYFYSKPIPMGEIEKFLDVFEKTI